MDDDTKQRLYKCPVCDEDKEAVYTHFLGDKAVMPGNLYITGMCLECLRERDPAYAIKARGFK